jgi:hypothetical protein
MTADALFAQMEKMENIEKNKFLDRIYDEYFDKGIPFETLAEHGRILEMYYDGELVEAEQDDNYGH